MKSLAYWGLLRDLREKRQLRIDSVAQNHSRSWVPKVWMRV